MQRASFRSLRWKRSFLLILLFLPCFQCGITENNQAEIDRLVGKYGERKEPPSYKWGSVILFGKYGNSVNYQSTGWSVPENGFTWALGNNASLDLRIRKPYTKSATLTIRFWPFLMPGRIDKQTMSLFINDEKMTEWIIRKPGVQEQAAAIPDGLLTRSSRLCIRFELPDAKSPAEVGYNADQRILSIAFCEIRLSESK